MKNKILTTFKTILNFLNIYFLNKKIAELTNKYWILKKNRIILFILFFAIVPFLAYKYVNNNVIGALILIYSLAISLGFVDFNNK